MAQVAENPLLEGLRARRAPEPCALVIFGASGDLTQRKLFPALYALAYRNLLPPQFGVVGVARSDMTLDEFRERMRAAVEEHARDEFREDVWEQLADGLRYVRADLADADDDEGIVEALNDLDTARGTGGNRVYYLAVPPMAIEPIVLQLGRHRATGGWTRVIVEKPF
ncbi:MAG: glucose-6-phosphate dehydrogenase, partial [Gaiellaceae bacterium]